MPKIPSTQHKAVRFRGPTDSAEYNAHQEDVFYDLMQLFQITNELDKSLQVTSQALELNSQFQHLYVQELENEVQKLKEALAAIESGTGKHTAYAYSEDIVKDPNALESEQAHLDPLHRLVHLPVTGMESSKTYIYDSIAKRIVLPSALKVEALPKISSKWMIEDTNLTHAVNGNNEEYWHRKMITDQSNTSLSSPTCEFIVTLPDTIISNRDINTVYLHPFPLNGVTVNKIEYRLDGDWKLLPGWKTDETGKPAEVARAGNIKLCFPSIAISQIKVTMTQHHWLEENTKKVYHFGIQELGIFYTDYQAQIGRIEIPFNLTGGNATKKLTGLKPLFSNSEALTDSSVEKSSLFSYQIYAVDETGQLQYTKDSFPILVNTDRIVVKAAVHRDPHSNANPTLESVELTYEDSTPNPV